MTAHCLALRGQAEDELPTIGGSPPGQLTPSCEDPGSGPMLLGRGNYAGLLHRQGLLSLGLTLQYTLLQADLHPGPGPDYGLKSPDQVILFQEVLAVPDISGDVLHELILPRDILIESLGFALPFDRLREQIRLQLAFN